MSRTPERMAVVRALFDAAVELPAAARDDFLAGNAPDEWVRREVASLLEAHDAPGDTFERPLPLQVGLIHEDRPALVGRALGPYRITREIGRGGMGTVYEAERADDQFTKRVAIKMLRAGTDTASVLRRFRREREIQAALSHPNIATLLDAGVTEAGEPYIVLEYVDGIPIDAYCEQHRLSLPARLDLFRQVIAAVQHAHRQLVVHRDLKPQNILVTGDGVVKLLDFGVSRLMDQDRDPATTDGLGGFTMAYASPEQLRALPLSTATDVYSLGTVLFRLLAGRHPFPVDPASPVAAWHAICEVQPPAPSSVATSEAARAMGLASAERLRRTLQGELDAIVLMALRKEPERRYVTANAMGDDLLNYLKGLPVEARPDSRSYRFRKLLARNRLAAAAIVLAVVAMGSGTGVALWQARVARVSASNADRERQTAEQVSDFLQGMFSAADASWRGQGARPGPGTTVLEVVDVAAERIERELADQPAVAERLHRTLASVYLTLGQTAKAKARSRDVVRYERARGAPPAELAYSLTDLAAQYFLEAQYDSATSLLEEAYALHEREGFPDSESLVVTLNQYGLVLWAQGRNQEAQPLLERAVAIRQRMQVPDATIAIALNNLGIIRDGLGDFDGGFTAFRQSDSVFALLTDREYFERAITHTNLGVAHFMAGEYARAETLITNAVEQFRESLGPESHYVAVSGFMLARLLTATGRPREALATFQRSLTGLAGAPPDHPNVARARLHEAEIRLALGELVDAERLARAALELRSASMPATDWRIAEVEGVLGQVLVASGKTAEGMALLQRSHEGLLRSLGPSHPRTTAAAKLLARDSAATR